MMRIYRYFVTTNCLAVVSRSFLGVTAFALGSLVINGAALAEVIELSQGHAPKFTQTVTTSTLSNCSVVQVSPALGGYLLCSRNVEQYQFSFTSSLSAIPNTLSLEQGVGGTLLPRPTISITASTSAIVGASYTYTFACQIDAALQPSQVTCDFDPPSARPTWLSAPICSPTASANRLTLSCSSSGNAPNFTGTVNTTIKATATRGVEFTTATSQHALQISTQSVTCPAAQGTYRGSYRASVPNTWTPSPTTNGIHYWILEPDGWQPAPGRGEVRWSSILSDYTEIHAYLTKCPGYAPTNPIGDPRVSAYLPPLWAAGSGAVQFIAADPGTPITTVVGNSVTTIANAPGLNNGERWYFVLRQVRCDFDGECPRSQYGTR